MAPRPIVRMQVNPLQKMTVDLCLSVFIRAQSALKPPVLFTVLRGLSLSLGGRESRFKLENGADSVG